MDSLDKYVQLATVYALPLLFGFTLHEAAHGYAARYFGDDTAAKSGGLSLNPARHIDLFGTIILPLIFFATLGMVFGYAKPTPVVYENMRNPKKQMGLTALAGPLANFAMGVLWLVFGLLLSVLGVEQRFFVEMARAGVLINASLFVFNMLPFPLFDGGTVLASLLPEPWGSKFRDLGRHGLFFFFCLILLMQTHLLDGFLRAAMRFVLMLFSLIVSPLYFLLG
jgi:Zn-dependent protease